MIGLAALAKIASGNVDPRSLKALLEGLGFQLNFVELESSSLPTAFQAAARSASQPAARVLSIDGTDREGSRIQALLVLSPVIKNT